MRMPNVTEVRRLSAQLPHGRRSRGSRGPAGAVGDPP
jgi:hypothetical protein